MTTHRGSTDSLRRVSLPRDEFPDVHPGDFLLLGFSVKAVTTMRAADNYVLVEVDPCRMVEG